MPTLNLYLDDRRLKKNGCAPLKVVIRNRSTSSLMPLDIDIPPACWDGSKCVSSKNKATDALLSHPPRVMCAQIESRMSQIRMIVDDICGWKSSITATALRDQILRRLQGRAEYADASSQMLLMDCWDEYTAQSTASSQDTYRNVQAYLRRNFPRIDTLEMCDIDEHWVDRMMQVMRNGNPRVCQKPLQANTVANYLNFFKAVWHYAQRRRYIPRDHEPFVGIKAGKVATRSRALLVEDMRKIWHYDVRSVSTHRKTVQNARIGRDIFCLSFCLCGLNMADLYNIRTTDIRNGRLETDRQKTGVHINIRIEPEAQEIIDRYSRDGYVLGRLRERKYKLMSESINAGLDSMIEGVTMYWARHTWASLAAELDIPDRTIFMGLAHRQGKASDETYITMRNRKLDAANRKVIDYVLGRIEAPE